MKKTIALCLLFCTVLAPVPAFVLAAAGNGADRAAAVAPPAYDDLYVTDGLAVHLVANEESVDLAAGTWTSRDGGAVAKLCTNGETAWRLEDGGLSYSYSSIAEYAAGRKTVGIDIPGDVIGDGEFTAEIVFTPKYITDGEGNIVPHSNEANAGSVWGAFGGDVSTFSLGGLQMCFFQPSVYVHTDGSYSGSSGYMRMFYYKSPWNTVANKVAIVNERPFGVYDHNKETDTVKDTLLRDSTVLSVTRTLKDAEGKLYQPIEFSVQLGSGSYKLNNGSGTAFGTAEGKKLNENFFPVDELAKPIGLFYGFPAEISSIRIYDRALTEEETLQNSFADIVKKVGVDLTDYAAMMGNGELCDKVHRAVVALGAGASAAELEQAILDAKAQYDEKVARIEADKKEREELLTLLDGRAKDEYDSYYVQDGLRIFLDGFVSVDGWNTDIHLANGTWTSKVGDVTATLGGKEYWGENATGKGVGYRLTKADYYASLDDNVCPIDISFDPALLPTDFTVETVAQFVGLSDEDGNRHVDPESGALYGIYTARYSAFSFGALKATTFICESRAQYGTPMSNRWCVTPLEWSGHNGKAAYANENLFQAMDPRVPTAFTIVKYEPNAATTVLEIYSEMATEPQLVKRYSTLPDDDPEFHLFKGMAATVFAVRVYDRRLTVREQAQNHVADLLSFYNLETDFLDMVLEGSEDPTAVYLLFNGLGFDMTRTEAVAQFRQCLMGAWLEQVGVSARLDGKIALRVEFDINEANMAALKAAGYRVEAGALLNMENAAYPTLETHEYQVVFHTENGGADERYVIGRDGSIARVAFAVNYNKPTPEMVVSELYWSGYVLLTAPDGERTVLYREVSFASCDTAVLPYYDLLRSRYGYEDNAFVCGVVDASYTKWELFVDNDGGNDANDGRTAPVKTLARAYELLIELGKSPLPVDVTVNMAAGKYALEDKLEFDGTDIAQKYARITLKGAEDDGAKITRNREFESGFTKVEGEEYYVHRFQKDADGKYPSFRTFYVNGRLQKLAQNGYSRAYEAREAGGELRDAAGNYLTLDPNGGGAGDAVYVTSEESGGVYGYDNMWMVPFEFDGVDNDKPNPQRKLYLHAEAFKNTTDADFATGDMEFHVGIAWYHRVFHVARVDWNDTKTGLDGETEYIAVYFDEEEIASYSKGMHTMNGWYYWVENALSFVDEAGEYYYDEANGALYYYPLDDVDMATAEFEYPTGGHILSFFDVGGLTLDGLVFYGNDNRYWEETAYIGGQASTAAGEYKAHTHTGLTAVWLQHTKDTAVKNCLFTDLASSAVKYIGVTRNATVESNRFFRIGSSAIEVGNRSGYWFEDYNALSRDDFNINENIRIQNNFLDDIAWLTRGSVAIIVSVGKEVDISYNTVWKTSYSALSIGWRWAPVEWGFGENWHLYHVDIHHNYFRGVMYGLSDGGVYTLGGNVMKDYHEYFNYMHHNFFYFDEVTWNGNYHTMVMPYYHDGASSNWHTYENVLILNPYRRVHAPIYVQNILDQLAMNVLVEKNEIVGAFKPWDVYAAGDTLTEKQWEYKIFGPDGNRPIPDHLREDEFRYYSRVDDTRFISQKDNTVYDDPTVLDILGYPMNIIDESGSTFAKPDSVTIVYEEVQPIYDAYYAELEEAYMNAE